MTTDQTTPPPACAPAGMDAEGICLCCGRPMRYATRPIHHECWLDHHNHPYGVWPLDHDCPFDPLPDLPPT